MRHITLLLVDDDPIEHKLFEAFVHQVAGVSVTLECVTTLDDALHHLSHDHPDMLFLDSQLAPHPSYKTTVPQILKSGFNGPLFVISSGTDDANVKETIAGVTAHIDKLMLNPTKFDALIADTLSSQDVVNSKVR